MTRFIAGNVWLLVGLTLILGRESVRYDPERIAFFGIGGWMHPLTYDGLTALAILVGAIFLYQSRKDKNPV